MTNFDDNVSTIISDNFSPSHYQQNHMGIPLSYKHSRRMIKIDEMNKANNAAAM